MLNNKAFCFPTLPILEDNLILLRPLHVDDLEELYAVASDPLLWEQHPAKERSQRRGFEEFFREALATNAAFTVIEKASGVIIGSTRYHPVPESSNAVEIGWTFLARAYWGGVYNQAMKKLMIDYAFGFVEHCIFCIHEHNIRSQKAVEKIGGQRIVAIDGVALTPRTNATVVYGVRRAE